MEQVYIAYVLGVFTVILIGMVVGIVRANIMVSKHVSDINDLHQMVEKTSDDVSKRFDEWHRDIYDHALQDVHRRIDENLKDNVNQFSEAHSRMSEINSYIDSRIDKLESKLKSEKA
jgi:MFS superfamily sulfate permease-like transporter